MPERLCRRGYAGEVIEEQVRQIDQNPPSILLEIILTQQVRCHQKL